MMRVLIGKRSPNSTNADNVWNVNGNSGNSLNNNNANNNNGISPVDLVIGPVRGGYGSPPQNQKI